MNKEWAEAIAVTYAKRFPESYYSEPFVPHHWVIEAIQYAFELGRDEEANSRTTE